MSVGAIALQKMSTGRRSAAGAGYTVHPLPGLALCLCVIVFVLVVVFSYFDFPVEPLNVTSAALSTSISVYGLSVLRCVRAGRLSGYFT